MYGQMTAGSWIYIGTQGILQGTYETFSARARKHFGGTLAGRLVLSAGLGGMGGAQPLAVTLNEGVGLFVEVDRGRIERRLRLRYVERMTASVDEALGWAEEARAKRTPLSIAVHGNAAEVHPELASRGVRFDVVTDQTSAHDMLNGYIPAGLSVEAAAELRARDPEAYLARAYASLAEHMRAMLELQKRGAILFDYGNNVRREAENAGVTDFAYPGFVPAFIRPLFCAGQGPFRWVALSGDPEAIYATDGALIALVNTAAGATWVSVHRGGGVGIGYSIHAGMVVVADGSADAARRLERVLTTDPGTGIMRHADAGYAEAIAAARRHRLDLPGITA